MRRGMAKWLVVLVAMATWLGACGDDDDTADSGSLDDDAGDVSDGATDDDDGSSDDSTDDDASTDDDDDGDDDGNGDGDVDFAPPGEIRLEIDGQTFTSTIASCQFEDDGPISIGSRDETSVNLNLGRDGDDFGALNAGVTVDGLPKYSASTGAPDDVTVDGRSIVVESDDFIDVETGESAGRGVLSATCE